MPTYLSANQRAKKFAAALVCLVREVLDRLPERELIQFLDEIHGKLGTELVCQRMELESLAGPSEHGETEATV